MGVWIFFFSYFFNWSFQNVTVRILSLKTEEFKINLKGPTFVLSLWKKSQSSKGPSVQILVFTIQLEEG